MGKTIITSWEKKLLDIGKRNQLINFRERLSSNLEFYYDDLFSFYDEFIDDKTFVIAKLFKNLDEFITTNDILEENDDEYNVKERVTNALGTMIERKDKYSKEEIYEIKKRFKPLKNKNYLYCAQIYNKASQALNLLRRKAKMYREENGIESLFMCFGFLSYKEGKETFIAPLTLVPTNIILHKFNDELSIKSSDDDFIINENLSQYLKLNYKIDLNKKDNDVSLKDYIKDVINKVKPFGITFIDKVELGIFSFSKIMMYNDIANNHDLLMNNKFIRLLAGYKEEIDNEIDTKIVEEPIINQNQVLPADSSQYMAIYYAKQNKSFVLQGPPGTGKSQTITNILAELIGQGKKVLFVCEKSSALDVVYNNLKKCNLSMYALPIYDTKANKKEIVKDIYNNIEYLENNNVKLNDKGKKIIDKVNDCKDFFDDTYYELINKNNKIKLSLYDLINLSNLDVADLNFNIDNILDIDKDEYEKILDQIDLITIELEKLNQSPNVHPYKGFNKTKVLKKDISIIEQSSTSCINYLESLYKSYNNLNSDSFRPKKISEIKDWIDILKLSSNPYNLTRSDFLKKDLENALKNSKKLEKIFKNLKESKEYFDSKYISSFLDLDVESDLIDLTTKYKLSIKRVFGYSKIEKKYVGYLIKKSELDYQDLVSDLTKLSNIQNDYQNIALLENTLSKDFNKYYFGSKTDFNKLNNIIKYLIDFNNAISKIKDFDKSKIIDSVVLANKEYEKEGLVIEKIYNNLIDSLSPLYNYFDSKSLDLSIPDLIIKLKNISIDPNQIYSYLDFNKVLNKLPENIQNILLENEIDTKTFKQSFIKHFAQLYLEKLYETNKRFDDLTDSHLNKILSDYKSNNDKLYEVSKIKISDKVTSSWPNINGLGAANLEVKTLRTEINKKRKLMSVRDLFSHMPHLLQSLKPIFMMSPLSVANYLDPKNFEFDCVIFDEASQITTENAVGAIYRSKQLIIVGDKEQLPPTSFFDSYEVDEEDEYDVYESILDEASSILPSIMLKWHYRSKDESLITYSNKEIYHDLVSFPCPYLNPDLGLRYEYVEDGIYEHNKRVNIKEANKVVDLIFYSFRHNPSKSIGVVTFNMSQESLILNLVNQRRRKDSAYESFFDENIKEPFFIKNLETVQGDERDIIILSTTFGPDELNKQSMNFGPINKEGGYRRLNVAITRAKEELIVVSSLDTSRFAYDKIKSRGVKMLGGFIDFARNQNKQAFSTNPSKEAFINRIVDILNKKGYKAITNVGDNSYKIDIAVLDNDDPSKIRFAILTDGLNYQNLKSSRDRNVLIDNVLELRGWKIFHIFMETSINNLENIIDNILKNIGNNIVKVEDNKVDIIEDISTKKEETILDVKSLFDTYPNIISIIEEERCKNVMLEEKLLNIIEKTSPINKNELMRLVSNPFFNKNLCEEITTKLEDAIKYLKNAKKIYIIVGYIIKPSDLLGLRFRRYDSLNPYNRTIDNIFIEELEEGFKTIISYVKQTSKQILFKTFNTLLGYPSESKKTIDTFNKVLQVLVDKALIRLDGDVISYI